MKKTVALFVVLFSMLLSNTSFAQKTIPLTEALEEVSKVFGTRFVYERSILAGKTTTVDVNAQKAQPVEDILKNILYPNELLFLYVDFNHYTIVKRDEKNLALQQAQNNRINNVNQAGVNQITVTGVVTSLNNAPLSGVSILARVAGTGTSTDGNGNFSIRTESSDVLVFSYVGYISQEVNVAGQTNINVVLEPQQNKMNEVVVIAYGSQSRRDLTGSVSTIAGKDLTELPATINIEQALQGRAAGVMVVQESGQPGAATRVRIRGSSSLLGSNQPLYIVDGIPVVAESNIPDDGSVFNNGLLQQGLNSPLGNINPEDVESISILKDASATAIYGSRAANGVVIITTKKGRGKPTYNFSSAFSYQNAQTDKILNAQQFREIWTEAAMNSTSTAAIVQDIKNGTYFGSANTNWADEITPADPYTKSFNFSVSGASDKLRYYTALSSQNQQGSFQNSYFNRYSFLVNLHLSVSKAISLGTSINLSTSKQGSPDGGLLTRIYTFRPDLPVFDASGNYSFSDYHNFENPVALSTASNVNNTGLLLGSIYGEARFADDFTFKSSLALNYNKGRLRSFYPSHTFNGGFTRNGPGPGFGQESASEFISTLWENTLNYNRTFNSVHDVNGVLGASWQGDESEFL
jgi:TonB-dependent starch-binding outer membrane protein SusC